MKYKVIDNFLNKKDFLELKKIIFSSDFPWYFNNFVSHTSSKDGTYFTHIFYRNYKINSNFFDALNPLLKILNPVSLIHVKANLYSKTNKIHEHDKHVDLKTQHKGFLYYINTNNGFTRLKNGEKIDSIENRGLFFDAHIEHNSSTCTDKENRININFNYF